MADTHPNIALVQRMYECFNRNDMDTIRNEIFAPDLVWNLPGRHPLSGTKNGAEEVLAALLTGPTVGLDDDVETVRTAWETHRRESNATETEAIECDRQSARWAMASIQVIGVAAAEAFQGLAEPLEVLTSNVKGQMPEGFGAFGLAPDVVRRAVAMDALKAA